ncbi:MULTISPECIES: MFS transporter [unclassified Streptomyces]|uniref:MFS transporter n=1 Tax=unclassified Streptomyces TaxID=2593676 RepID=UPI002E82299B|nr:MFS transporter [Streptomyces sp. NBC_00589]WTI36299.1 MFS transporter [Streptomyces sp. NBC_00775]WUB30026.1 MFS transporter [Streptomyces sp. NBC_00589]
MAVTPDASLGARSPELPAQDTPSPEAPATAENAPAKLILTLAFAQFGAYLAVLTPVMVTLALRVSQIVPEGDRGSALGQVLSVGALLAMLGNPVFGALSDRTTSRFGRRRPWLIGGMAVGVAGLMVVALGGNVPVLMLGWALAQLGINATLAALTSCVPDLIPPQQQARVSGVIGVTTSLSMIGGSVLAQVFSGSMALAFLVPGVIGLGAVALLAVTMPDRPARTGAFEPYSVKEFARSFWVNPRRHPDFAWNFAGRFLVFTGAACVTSYQVYFLMDRLGYDDDQVTQKVLVGTLVMVATTVVGSLLGGQLSDRSGRRKPYVLGSSLIMALSLAMIASAQGFGMYVAALAVFGAGQGLYLSVDMALAAAVLPNPEESAKDMGVLNIGNALPQSLVPMVAPAFLAIGGGGNYGALFLFGAVAAVLGALAVQFVRSVK